VGAANETYTYGTTNNRLSSLTPLTGPVRNFVNDANGSTTNDAINQFTFDARGRLVQANTSVGTVQYRVNSLGQRIRKTSTSADTVYHYDSGGRLIAETSASGVVRAEYIYLNDIPVAVVR
jgi:YD repeat-containing protein